MKVRYNSDEALVQSLKEALVRKDGYCPCRRERIPENKCMCKEFRDQMLDNHKVQIVEEEADVIRLIFSRYAIVEDVFLTAGRVLVFHVDVLYSLPQHVVYDFGIDYCFGL